MESAVTDGSLRVPPVVMTSSAVKPLGASLKVKVTVAVSPALTALTSLVMARVGATVSTDIDRVEAELSCPSALVNCPAATLTLAVVSVSVVGVKVAV